MPIAFGTERLHFPIPLPFGRLWYTEIPHAIGYAKHRSRSPDAVIRVCDGAGNVIETQEHKGQLHIKDL